MKEKNNNNNIKETVIEKQVNQASCGYRSPGADYRHKQQQC